MQCRSCMDTESSDFVEMVTTASNGLSLFEYFNTCTQLNATFDDELPKTLCISCSVNLRSAYYFVQQARQSDVALRLIVSAHKQEVPEPPDLVISKSPHRVEFGIDSNEDIATFDPLGVVETVDVKPNLDELEGDAIMPVQSIKEESEQKDELYDENDDNPLAQPFTNSITVVQSASESSLPTEDETDDIYMPSKETEKSQNTCLLCEAVFSTKNLLRSHLKSRHKSELECSECTKCFSNPNELHFHKRLSHSETLSVQCTYCPSLPLIPREKLKTHFRLNHGDLYKKYFSVQKQPANKKTYACEFCSKRYTTPRSKKFHQKVQHPESLKAKERPYKCEWCPKEFASVRNRRLHKKNQHAAEYLLEVEKNKAFKCPHCPKKVANARGYKAHIKREHSDILNDTPSSSKEALEEKIVTNGPVECSYCKKEILPEKIKTHEARHRRSEKEGKKFLCAYCPHTFRDSVRLKSHEKKIHLEKPEPIECHICHKKVNPEYLDTHIKGVHTDQRNFACDICGNTFKAWVQLYTHKRLHQERKWECTICHKKYIRQVDLTIHMRSHTGERPFACHLCDERFSIKVRLTYHLQKHAGIKHRCKECGKEYVDVKGLKQHMFKHIGMPYRCTICKYACGLRDLFTKHLLRVHNTTMSDQDLKEMFKSYTGRMPRIAPVDEPKKSDKDAPEEGEELSF